MASDLDTTPRDIEVTTDMAGVWEVTFAAAMTATGAASIAAASAALTTAMSGDSGATVAGFVTSAIAEGTSVNVTWDASVLAKHGVYQLQTLATFDNDRTVEFLTEVRCVG